jgi:hypothetical protein
MPLTLLLSLHFKEKYLLFASETKIVITKNVFNNINMKQHFNYISVFVLIIVETCSLYAKPILIPFDQELKTHLTFKK